MYAWDYDFNCHFKRLDKTPMQIISWKTGGQPRASRGLFSLSQGRGESIRWSKRYILTHDSAYEGSFSHSDVTEVRVLFIAPGEAAHPDACRTAQEQATRPDACRCFSATMLCLSHARGRSIRSSRRYYFDACFCFLVGIFIFYCHRGNGGFFSAQQAIRSDTWHCFLWIVFTFWLSHVKLFLTSDRHKSNFCP